MKVLIAGGTGLIGSALANDLVQGGHEAVVLTRNPGKPVPHLLPGVRRVGWDGKSGAGWSEELAGARAVVNLAGETIGPQAGLWTEARKHRIRQSRLDATRALLDGIGQAAEKPALLVQASGVGYYGTSNERSFTEEDGPGNDFLAGVVAEWEKASEPVEEMGVRRVISRMGVVLARQGGTLQLISLPFKLFVGGPVGSGRQPLPWVHIDDVVGALRFFIEQDGLHGPFNVVAPDPVTNRTFGNVLGRVLGRPSLFPTPAFLLKLVLGEMSTIVLDGQQVIPGALQEAGYRFRFPELEPALRDLLG